jgi:hypothetical protein
MNQRQQTLANRRFELWRILSDLKCTIALNIKIMQIQEFQFGSTVVSKSGDNKCKPGRS